jgi:hypothetical protein
MKKLEPSDISVWSVKWCSFCRKQFGGLPKSLPVGQVWWYMLLIPATEEVKIEESWSKAR